MRASPRYPHGRLSPVTFLIHTGVTAPQHGPLVCHDPSNPDPSPSLLAHLPSRHSPVLAARSRHLSLLGPHSLHS
ncbi:hypothetical protein E2C01_026032 [Portunus trituberculatus]|uniref:Uncharacterized protein n=1 Tax=Portunus trituberculatus TaxID=210409 RepID=A0A5B7EHR8_PORTR|nr:hypothetical protein [Portunus trituberculatus]